MSEKSELPHESQLILLTQEVALLRRQGQFLKQLGILIPVVVVGLCMLMGSSTGRNLTTADSWVLNDPVTKQRLIDMVTMNSGAAGFQVWDRNGTRRILLGTNHQSQPGLTLWDSKGRQRILVGLNNDDIPAITIWDSKEHHRITIGLDANDNPQVVKLDLNGNQIK